MSDHVDDLAIALGLADPQPSPDYKYKKSFAELYTSALLDLTPKKPKLTPEEMNKLGYLGDLAPIIEYQSPTKEEFYGENEEEEDEDSSLYKPLGAPWDAILKPAPPDHLLKNWHFHSLSASPVSLHVKNINHMTQEEAHDKVQEILANAMQIKLILSDKGGIHYDCFISVHPEHVLIQDFKAK